MFHKHNLFVVAAHLPSELWRVGERKIRLSLYVPGRCGLWTDDRVQDIPVLSGTYSWLASPHSNCQVIWFKSLHWLTIFMPPAWNIRGGASSNWIVRPSVHLCVCLFVPPSSCPLFCPTYKVQYLMFGWW